jgi:hypothetical protein
MIGGLQVYPSWFSPADGALRHQIESGILLVERHGELMDRYDARLLLDRPLKNQQQLGAGTRLNGALDDARFADLLALREEQREAERVRAAEAASKRRKLEELSAPPPPPPPPPATFDCPFEIPANVTVPLSEKQHNVIWTLVQFEQKSGGPVENLAQKQAANPLFNFLSTSHELHAYYQYLQQAVATKTLRRRPEDRFFEEIPKAQAAGGALSALLGSNDSLQRLVVDRFARYCKEYGSSVKKKILARIPEGDNRFAFLSPDDSLHEYYLNAIRGPAEEQPQLDAPMPQPPPPPHAPSIEERRQLALELLKAEGFVRAYDPRTGGQ